MKKFYKFKGMKHSVIMTLDRIDSKTNTYHLHCRDYPSLKYTAQEQELEEIKL